MSEKNKRNFKEKVSDMLVLPKEIVLDLPRITLVGNTQILIENYKGVIEYDSERIRINTSKGLIKVFGEGLEINTMTTEEIFITGSISTIEFGY